ncbi:cytochrome P450 [Actinokineospora bangkokensis]|uniref:Cytochrome n=1 Tax=Actinokineospora bangkokensis TaxID=1193682 RepID=A0A1Q9LNS5_9PSEU|nr:cytochrome P450 [Actinokineospora bangkokensis]OLR93707.1 hypothetical protein BJP25_15735 [Actinokineospora bangkokensis]
MTTTLVWNPLDPASIQDPYPIYAELRERCPVYWHEGMSSWVLTRYDDCQWVLRDHAAFARDRRRAGAEIPDDKLNIQTQDPPEQALLRGVTARSLNSQRLQEICAEARELMEHRLRGLAGAGPFDLMRDLAGPGAIHVINNVFGVHAYTQDSYAPIYRGLTQAMDSGLDPERLAPGRAAGRALSEEVGGWFADGLGQDGLLGMVTGHADVPGLPTPYVVNTIAATYNAGFSTLYASTGAITLEVLRAGPALLADLDPADPHVLTLAADELMRFTSPAQATARVALEPVELHGVRIEPKQTIVTMMAAANRDPRQFADPDRIVLDRAPNRHLAFAWGPHICLGARLAMTWAAEVIAFLAEHGPRLRLAGQEEYMRAATLRNLVRLPLEYAG